MRKKYEKHQSESAYCSDNPFTFIIPEYFQLQNDNRIKLAFQKTKMISQNICNLKYKALM